MFGNPEWVRVASGHCYGLLKLEDYWPERKLATRPEIKATQDAITAIHIQVSERVQKADALDALSALINSRNDAAILEMVRKMKFDENFVTILLRAGVDRREPGYWPVRGSWSEFTLKPIKSRLVNGKITPEDKEVACQTSRYRNKSSPRLRCRIGHSH